MSYIAGKQAFLEILKQEGVSIMFGNPGTTELPLMDGLARLSAEDDVYVGMDLDRPFIDYVGLAKALGVPGEHVEKTAEVPKALERGLRSRGPYLIDVRIDATFK